MDKKIAGKGRPTQADVARLAGVSQALVSQILNGNSTLAISEETRQRIVDAIDQLGYVPDRRAQSLRTRKTYTLASIIPDITNPFYPAFQRGIQDVVESHGYDLVMYNTDGVAAKEEKSLRSVQQGFVDGVIGVFFHMAAEQLWPLLERNVAVTRLEGRPHLTGPLPLDNIYVDNAAAAHLAVSYLIERGHQRIGMIAGDQGPRDTRLAGYRQALATHGLVYDAGLVRDADFTEQGGYEGMHTLLALPSRPTAVFAANDMMALGALLALREAGLRVPQEMAVMGFDDIPVARLVSPALTTVAQFQEQLGRRAAEMVLERLSGTLSDEGRCEEMPYKLIVRESA